MSATVCIELQPLGKRLHLSAGAGLQEALFQAGVEFPCGARARCKGCRVRVLRGEAPPTAEDRKFFPERELAEGWRLACRMTATDGLTIEAAQWDAHVLGDDRRFDFIARKGLGVAIDLGTTTVAAQLLDLEAGRVIGVRTALNDQARHGGDIMSRIEFGMQPEGLATLRKLVRDQLGTMVSELIAERADGGGAGSDVAATVSDIVIVGNTAMHHIVGGLDVGALAHTPFHPVTARRLAFRASEFGWTELAGATVHVLPCLGGFVGGDILAGILATGMADSPDLGVLIDLGTNGELVVGNRDRMLCASTAAGPAFEGARISMGMRAATGAIAAVARDADGSLACKVLGGGPPRGLCGSGLVDAVAVGLDAGWILPNGRFQKSGPIPLSGPVTLAQADVRELQLAKGAIAAGLGCLLARWGAELGDVRKVWLAGAFGNYISRVSARRIGLLPFPLERVDASGNTALLGAKMALCQQLWTGDDFAGLLGRVEHVPLNEDPSFEDGFIGEMRFPDPPTAGRV